MNIWEFRGKETSGVDEETERLAFEVIGAAIEVHKELGPGLPEVSYKKAMCRELTLRGIPYRYELPIDIMYKGVPVGEAQIDILVADRLVVEAKTVDMLSEKHRAQTITYLQLKKLKLGLLLNFNVVVMKDGIKRVINTYH